MNGAREQLAAALWRLYRRPERPAAWAGGGNLPWHEPAFSKRMVREHLDESHGAASRTSAERMVQIDWLWTTLGLQPGMHILDVTCGPGLYAIEVARRGCTVTGVDFGPAAIAYARILAEQRGVAERCTFIEQDVRTTDFGTARYDAVLFLYGQLAVFPKGEAADLIVRIHRALKPGGALLVELLDQERVDKTASTWWYTDDTGLWGDAPFLQLGERFWDAEGELSLERFTVIHLDSGSYDEIVLCDQTYAIATMTTVLHGAGFATVTSYPSWAGVPLYDAPEWVVYVAKS
jgi:SAM-dependent methyltransferase